MKKPLLLLMGVGMTLGCMGNVPVRANALQLRPAATAQFGCHEVAGFVEQSGVFPNFIGTISGDITGTISTEIVQSGIESSNGSNITVSEQSWVITGGKVRALVGRTIRLTVEGDASAAPFTARRYNSAASVIEGAISGTLTYRVKPGATSAALTPPPFEFRGTICP